MAMIFVLERVAGMSSSMQSVVRALVNSIGILIGFAWEKARVVLVCRRICDRGVRDCVLVFLS